MNYRVSITIRGKNENSNIICTVIYVIKILQRTESSRTISNRSLEFQMKLPYQWQPKIVSTQVAIIGNVVIAGVPGEFTTMSGRRLREVIKEVMNDASDETSVIVAGLCNTYSDYVTTPEEYQVKFSLLLLKHLLENRGCFRDFAREILSFS